MRLENCAYCKNQPLLEKRISGIILKGCNLESYRYVCECAGGHHGERVSTEERAVKIWNRGQDLKLMTIRRIKRLQEMGLCT